MRAYVNSVSRLAGCGWFWAWALVGVGFGFGISAVGLFTVPLAVLAVVFMARRSPIDGTWGIATGIGLVLLLVSYLQRGGEHYNPIYWLVPGLVLFFGGIVAHTRASRDE